MRVATWNLNSVKVRLPHVLNWLEKARPDVLVLQEIKCETEAFPAFQFQKLGYTSAVFGQKAYNGVAILSRSAINKVVLDHLPGGAPDAQARYAEVLTGGFRVASIYLPNGNPVDSDKYLYKLDWMDRLRHRAKELALDDLPAVLGGDFNVAPEDADVYDPRSWATDAICRPETRTAWRRLMNLGLTDAFRALNTKPGCYSWWNYRGNAWGRGQGLRIDHLLLNPAAADRLLSAGIDQEPRGWEKASDHAPVWCELA